MLQLKWTTPARRDLLRLYDFLREASPRAAKRILSQLEQAARQLPTYPEMAPRLEDYAPRNVRSLVVGDYEMRFEITPQAIIILRVWHTREDR